MAHKTGSGSSKNGRDSISKRLGIKQNFLFNFFMYFFILQKIIYIFSIFLYFIKNMKVENKILINNNFLFQYFLKKNRKYYIFTKNKLIKPDTNQLLYSNLIFSTKNYLKKFKYFFIILKNNKLIFNNYPYNIYYKKILFNTKYLSILIINLIYILIKRKKLKHRYNLKFVNCVLFVKIIFSFLTFKFNMELENMKLFSDFILNLKYDFKFVNQIVCFLCALKIKNYKYILLNLIYLSIIYKYTIF